MTGSEAYWFEFLCQPLCPTYWKFQFHLVQLSSRVHDRVVFLKTKQIKDASGYLGVGKVVLPFRSKDFLCSSCHRLKLEMKCVSMASAVQSEFSLKLRFFYFFLKKAGSQCKGKIKAQRAFSNFSKISAQNSNPTKRFELKFWQQECAPPMGTVQESFGICILFVKRWLKYRLM